MKTYTKNTTQISNTPIYIQKFDKPQLRKNFQNYYKKNAFMSNLIKRKAENKINKKFQRSIKILYKIVQKFYKSSKYVWLKIIPKSESKALLKKIKYDLSNIIAYKLVISNYSWSLDKKKIQKYPKWNKLSKKNKNQNSIIFKNEFRFLIKELQIKKKKKITEVIKLKSLLEIAVVWLRVRKFFLAKDVKNLKNVSKIQSDPWGSIDTKKCLYSSKKFIQIQIIHYLVFPYKRKIIQFYQFYSLFAVVSSIRSNLYKYFSYNFIIILGQNWYKNRKITNIFQFNSITKFQRSRMLFFIKFLWVMLNHPTKILIWDPKSQEYKLKEKKWASLKLAPTTDVRQYRNIYVWHNKRVRKKVKDWFKNRNKPKYTYIQEWDSKKKVLSYKRKWKLVHKKLQEITTLLKKWRLQRIFYKNRKWRSIRLKKRISFYKYICGEYTNISSRKRSFRKWKAGTAQVAFLKKYKWPKWPKWKRIKYIIPKFLHVNYIYRTFYLFIKKQNISDRYFPGIYRIFYYQYNNISNRVLLIRPDELSLNITTTLDAFVDFPSKFKEIEPSLEEFATWLYITYCVDIHKKTNIQTNFIISNPNINPSNSLKPKLLNLITKYNSILNSFYPEWSELQLDKTTTEEARLYLIHRVFKIIGFNSIPEKNEIENLNKAHKRDKHEDLKDTKKKSIKITQSSPDDNEDDQNSSFKEDDRNYKTEERDYVKLWNTPEKWIRKRKLIFKLKILFDLLFLWLYRHKNAVYLFHFIRKRVFKFYPKSYQIIYKKNIKIRFNSARMIKP